MISSPLTALIPSPATFVRTYLLAIAGTFTNSLIDKAIGCEESFSAIAAKFSISSFLLSGNTLLILKLPLVKVPVLSIQILKHY